MICGCYSWDHDLVASDPGGGGGRGSDCPLIFWLMVKVNLSSRIFYVTYSTLYFDIIMLGKVAWK